MIPFFHTHRKEAKREKREEAAALPGATRRVGAGETRPGRARDGFLTFFSGRDSAEEAWIGLSEPAGITADREKMRRNLNESLMLVTALNPYIGYEKAAQTAKKAFRENISLKEACVALGFLTPERFDEVFHPEEMI